MIEESLLGISSSVTEQLDSGNCRNCGTILQGDFCHQCGQSSKVIRRPVSELFGEVTNHLLQWDSRLIHTLRNLFFQPGQLSLDWVEGKRMRYVPPFRLYIIASFVFFLLVGILSQGGDPNIGNASLTDKDVSEELQKASEEAEASGDWFAVLIIDAIEEVTSDPSAYFKKLISNLPKAAFLLLPVFALLHIAVEFRKDRYYIDYLVFSLNFHTFAFLLLSLIVVIGFISSTAGGFAQLLNFLIPIYAIIGIRRFNPQGWLKSCLKGFLVFGAYSILLGMGIGLYAVLILFL